MKNWIKSSWGISIGTAIFSLLLTMGYDYSKDKPILSTVWNILIWIWDFILTILNFNLKVWWIIGAIIIFILILYVIDKFKKKESFKPDFYSYRKDKVKRWKWTWIWKWKDSKNAWVISDFKAHCPNCDTPMIDNSNNIYGLSFECPRCNYQASGDNCDDPFKIEHLILDNIDRKRKEKSI
tara:strand:+ start:140 stop:682 length:543 start_codon:yes stop_codon:yes gene_type:complete